MGKLMRALGLATVVVPIAVATSVAQSPSFAGNWKLNFAKSQLGGTVYTISKTPSGMLHYSSGGFDSDFDLSGKEHATPSGVAVIGKELSPTSWTLTFRQNGKTVQTSHLTLHGDSVTGVADVIGADGKATQQKSTSVRVSGGPGFLGKWKTGEQTGTWTLKITLNGTNGITIASPVDQSIVKGNFDGKDYPVMQAGKPLKVTNAFTKMGNAIKVTSKFSGKALSEDVYTLSADGKTLTDESTALATGEKTRAVFDRM